MNYLLLKIRSLFYRIKLINNLRSKAGGNRLVYIFTNWDTERRHTKIRSYIIIVCFLLGYSVIAFRIIDIAAFRNLQVVSSMWGSNNRLRKEIIDGEGNLLAVNLVTASFYANPKKVIDKEEALVKLKGILPDLDYNKITQDLYSNKHFVWIKRNLSPKTQQALNNLGLPGFEFQRESKRVYTQGNLFSHVIGFVGNDGMGLAGIEKYFDKLLRYQDYTVSYEEKKEPLQLSLELKAQNILSQELEEAIEKFSAAGAVGVIADAENGEIIAMVSKPDFNPHYPGKFLPEALFNKASSATYEIGSAIKSLTMAIGIDSGKVSLNDVFDLNAKLRISNYDIKDFYARHKGWRSLPEIFMYSSNIGTAQIVLETGKAIIREYYKKLGLMDNLSIEIPEKGYSLFPAERMWTDLNLITMGYGHGMSMTPLHLVRAFIPLVNGGKLYPLTLIKGKNDLITPQQVLKEETSRDINKLLRLVVTNGTGRKANVAGYIVGGKTGTANKAINGKYSKDKRISSFIAAFPMVKPKYVILVTLDEPHGIKETFGFATAGFTVAPTIGKIVSRLGSVYGIKPYDDLDEEVQNLEIEYKVNDSI